MLLLILVFLVNPYLVWIVALKFGLSFFIILTFFLRYFFCVTHVELRQARLCRILFEHLGRLCTQYTCFFVFLWLSFWGLLGDLTWDTLSLSFLLSFCKVFMISPWSQLCGGFYLGFYMGLSSCFFLISSLCLPYLYHWFCLQPRCLYVVFPSVHFEYVWLFFRP